LGGGSATGGKRAAAEDIPFRDKPHSPSPTGGANKGAVIDVQAREVKGGGTGDIVDFTR
jgi:hypothetical protein